MTPAQYVKYDRIRIKLRVGAGLLLNRISRRIWDTVAFIVERELYFAARQRAQQFGRGTFEALLAQRTISTRLGFRAHQKIHLTQEIPQS